MSEGARCSLATLALGGMIAGHCLADDVVFSDKARFRIPYQLDAAEIKRLRASEIQLHVSTDRGKKWRQVDSVPPVAGKFTFEAAQDGEYWFSVRTVGDDGRHHPAGPLEAGLKVHVDTIVPTLSLQLTPLEDGQVALSWSAEDEYLDVDSLRIESRTGDSEEWEPVKVVAIPAGETSWSVPAGTVLVRGRVRDLAGNQVLAQSETTIAGASAPAQPGPSRQSERRPIAEGLPGSQQPAEGDSLARATPPQAISAPQPVTSSLPLINPQGSDYSQFVSQHQAEASPNAASPTPAPQGTTPKQPYDPFQQSAAPDSTSQPPASPQRHVRRVNSTSFHIGYALDDVGPSGVSSIDLYLTENNGRQWFHYGADQDQTSPFEVTVPQDGEYGFALRVRSGVGLAAPPPQPGEPPELIVSVDRVPPSVTLDPLKQGPGQQPTQMLIKWSMSDAELADRPVSLYYASSPSGPWQPITGWEPNTGQYLWTFGPDVPRQVYIRLEARDTAGNIARADSPEPLLIDFSRPTARILDVESLAPRK